MEAQRIYTDEIDKIVIEIKDSLGQLGTNLVAIEKKLVGVPRVDEGKSGKWEEPQGWLEAKRQDLVDIKRHIQHLTDKPLLRLGEAINTIGKEKKLKIIIKKIPVELVDRGKVKPFYNMKVEDLEGDIKSADWEGLKIKEVIKSIKRILQDEN